MNESELKERQPLPWMMLGLLSSFALIVIGLFLPPISLGRFVVSQSYPVATVTSSSSPVSNQVVGLELKSADALPIINSVSVKQFEGGRPISAEPLTEIYTIKPVTPEQAGTIEIALPSDLSDLRGVDMYGWSNGMWYFIPSQFEGDKVVSAPNTIFPFAVVLGQTIAPAQLAVGVIMNTTNEMSSSFAPLTNEVTVGKLVLGEQGVLNGEIEPITYGYFISYLRTTNRESDQGVEHLLELLDQPALQDKLVAKLVKESAENGYRGVHIDYQGIPAERAEAFTQFIRQLNQALDDAGLELLLTLATPEWDGTHWQTQGQDWGELGQLADIVYAEMPLDPQVYQDGGLAEQSLYWMTRLVDRGKLRLSYNMAPVDQIENSFQSVSYEQALKKLGKFVVNPKGDVQAGSEVSAELRQHASPLEWDGNAITYKYDYKSKGKTHTIWLANEGSLAYQMRFAKQYHLRGVVVSGFDSLAVHDGYKQSLERVMGKSDAPNAVGAEIVWTVEDEAGQIIYHNNRTEVFEFKWLTTGANGRYLIKAVLAFGDSLFEIGSHSLLVSGLNDGKSTASSVETRVATDGASGIINAKANYRQGPDRRYAIYESLAKGSEIAILGRDQSAEWLKIAPEGKPEGWVASYLVDLPSGVTLEELLIFEVAPDAKLVPTATPSKK